MTNEDKIYELVNEFTGGRDRVNLTDITYEEMVDCLTSLAEWKDEQYNKDMATCPANPDEQLREFCKCVVNEMRTQESEMEKEILYTEKHNYAMESAGLRYKLDGFHEAVRTFWGVENKFKIYE